MSSSRLRSASTPLALAVVIWSISSSHAFQTCTWLGSRNPVILQGTRAQSRWSCSMSQPFPQDISDLLVESGYDLEALNRIGRKLRTPAATCLRVNTLRADVDLVAAELEEHCLASCGFRPSILRHPILSECLILPPRFNPNFRAQTKGNGAGIERVVLVGRLCGEAVLQGADVYAPGVAAVPADLREGETVSVYADITDCVQRGGVTAGHRPKATDLVVSPDNAVLDDVCMLQSLPAAVVAHVVDPQPGERVLDMCAAPGGKATHLAQLMEDRGEVVACDRSRSKVTKITQLADRLRLKAVRPTKADATSCVDKGIFEPGLRPSLRIGGISAWSSSQSSQTDAQALRSLPSYQRSMLHQAHAALKPGGKLVFSTCTLNPLENEANVAWAVRRLGLILESQDSVRVGGSGMEGHGLTENDAAKVQRFSPGEEWAGHTATSEGDEVQQDSFAGFFIAAFRKAA